MGTGNRQEMDTLMRKYKDICADLNMDKSTADEALSSFHRIGNNYTLEGEKLHWLACALYVACRKSRTPTVKGNLTDGNFVSLTRLLKSCNLSLVQFFLMMKKWADMANLSQEMRNKIDYLERNFNVTTIIFKKYRPLFLELFKDPDSQQQKQSKSKKQRNRQYITTNSLFKFCWTLFVQVKSNFSAISADLVNSYHLLIACLDFCFNNVLCTELAKDLLNPTFDQLPSGFDHDDFIHPKESICIIKTLCDKYQGIYVDAKGIKEHWYKPYIKRIAEKKLMRCHDLDQLLGFFDNTHYDFNFKSITKKYDTYVLNFGDFDERIFLCPDAQEELGTTGTESLSQQLNQIRQHIEQKKSLTPVTPLTNRHLLQNRDHYPMTPISNATQTVSRLQTLLVGYSDQPSSMLLRLFERCKENPSQAIEQRLQKLGDQFVSSYCLLNAGGESNGHSSSSSSSSSSLSTEFAKRRLQFGITLYYKMLENITKREVKRMSTTPTTDSNCDSLASVLTNSMFHVSLFACCMEIVLFAYNSSRVFPWIIDTLRHFDDLNFQPCDFYKVIELIIRDEDGLSRDVVKHLNLIEEKILESLAWKSDSNIWERIRLHGSVPSYQDVALPVMQENQGPPASPLTTIRQMSQPTDRFTSPASNISIRRRLFDSTPQTNGDSNGTTSQPQVVQLALQTQGTGEVRYIISYPQNVQQSPTANTPSVATASQPKTAKIGPLGLFFRKVYHLSWIRMKDLCDRLDIAKDEELRKIWTCFEAAIRLNIDLLKDRHIDQLIMCTIYSMGKISNKGKTFYEIMGAYRYQPQYQSHVYRSILLSNKPRALPINSPGKDVSHDTKTSQLPPTPSKLAGSKSTFEFEERGDIIMFYNQVYVTELKKYIMRFFVEKNDSCQLSPLPRLSSHPISPYRRISSSHSVFVSPLKSTNLPVSPKKPNIYCFNVSPANDLKMINQIVKGNPTATTGQITLPTGFTNSFAGLLSNGRKVGKRIFQDNDTENSPTKRLCPDASLLTSKIENVFSDRQVANESDHNNDSNLD